MSDPLEKSCLSSRCRSADCRGAGYSFSAKAEKREICFDGFLAPGGGRTLQSGKGHGQLKCDDPHETKINVKNI